MAGSDNVVLSAAGFLVSSGLLIVHQNLKKALPTSLETPNRHYAPSLMQDWYTVKGHREALHRPSHMQTGTGLETA